MLKVGVIGGSGYTGGELLRILFFHPEISVEYVTSRQYKGSPLTSIQPNLRGVTNLRFEDYETKRVRDCDLVFLAVPHKASMDKVPDILSSGIKVIDLSADFRLRSKELYEQYYCPHIAPEYLEKAVYGLPELHREEIRKADLIASPGCLSSSIILGLAPIVKAGLIDNQKIIADSKIGSNAAGASFNFMTHHPERANVVRPYQVCGHRHLAEIEQELSALAEEKVTVGFTPHAVDMVRGILSTMHGFLKKDLEEIEVRKTIKDFYENEPFIRILKMKKGFYQLPNPKLVIGSNYCDIGFEIDNHANRLIIISAIDNLVKGSAGPAVHSMNIRYGFKETLGLEFPGLYPA
jgi:N-acetyl-gamma-glutamyl-phosphate/LysW-gamma-L-alpha-aminoadipyl-6-phosphate reductase